jgi:hypothetical protein
MRPSRTDNLSSTTFAKKVLEYCLFQPGLFTNYLTAPYKSAKHLTMFSTPFDLDKRRMLVVDGGEGDVLTITTVQDLAKVVVAAVEYHGVWPVDGGMVGSKVSVGELVGLGEKIRSMFSCASGLENDADVLMKGEVSISRSSRKRI